MGGKFRFGDRPEGELTIEEIRLAIAAMAGPLRTTMGRHQSVVLTANVIERIALNRSAQSLFVDVRGIQGVAIATVLFSPQSSADTGSSIGVDLSSGTFQQVLLMGEELWALSVAPTTIMVTEVQV